MYNVDYEIKRENDNFKRIIRYNKKRKLNGNGKLNTDIGLRIQEKDLIRLKKMATIKYCTMRQLTRNYILTGLQQDENIQQTIYNIITK